MVAEVPEDNTPDECPQVRDLAEAFKVLSDANRLRILFHLATDTTGTLGVSDLAARVGISQPAVSQHLKLLKSDGLVESERVGFHVNFTLNRARMVQIAGQFEQVRSIVLSRCNQQLVREKIPKGPLNIVIVYYSYSGITRGLMEKIQEVCGGDLIEIHTLKKYRSFTAFTTGCLRSRNEEKDQITPDVIDVSAYDLLVIATPVWAWKPAPAANSLVAGLTGCEGKKAFVCTTYSSNPGHCLPILKKDLEEKGVVVAGEAAFSRRETEDSHHVMELIRMIIEAYQT
ncbi:MAG TPA: metalloregulator ArsR/SmtB family transcription factor [Methanospirillum sp.]|uniref:metalloregulator ArsR/SmtB family transcription factor n=1 Tax=Methanospirillum sp. TaxID=45200 RepID=UPI002B5BAA68|nr:metalloregulator ArsR/SmtB family transcription factor [Methanospirillum sp.]HWQ63414.1 metalloregulator ArsR/SmtB family transcription factor [Methanospirillum sp.]